MLTTHVLTVNYAFLWMTLGYRIQVVAKEIQIREDASLASNHVLC